MFTPQLHISSSSQCLNLMPRGIVFLTQTSCATVIITVGFLFTQFYRFTSSFKIQQNLFILSDILGTETFVVPRFLNDFRITSGVIESHAALIHWSRSTLDGALLFPALVLSTGPLKFHSSYSSESLFLNGLFHDTSVGCNLQVHPPRITHRSLLYFVHTSVLTDWIKWPLNQSHTKSRQVWLFTPQIFCSQNFMLFSSAQDLLPVPHI